MTSATTTATSAIIARTLGAALVHSALALRRAGRTEQVGDEVDRAGGEHGAMRAGKLPRALDRAARVALDLASPPADLARQRRRAWPAAARAGCGAR